MLPPLLDAGSTIGELRDGSLGLPLGLPVVVGGGDTQMASLGVGGLAPGIVTVVAGTTTPLQATASSVPDDPERHPWVSAHLLPGRWAVEVNAGYAGMSFDWLARLTGHDVADLADEARTSAPGADGIAAVVAAREWSEAAWSHGVPAAVVGIDPRHSRADVARAFMEAHAYAIRGNLDDLDRILGTPATAICLTGGAARSDSFCQLVADVTGRPIHQADETYPTGRGFAWLAGRATMTREAPPGMAGRTIEPREHAAYVEGYDRFVAAGDAIGRDLRGWAT
jgi:sugar (pentulose or hexulose) kinase